MYIIISYLDVCVSVRLSVLLEEPVLFSLTVLYNCVL